MEQLSDLDPARIQTGTQRSYLENNQRFYCENHPGGIQRVNVFSINLTIREFLLFSRWP